MSKLTGKVAIVTGASKGIGAAIAEELAAQGAAVVVNARTEAAADAVVQRIQAKGGKAAAVAADLGTSGGVETLFAGVTRAFGKADILVNNAGVFEFKPIDEVTEEHYRRQFDLNVKGLLFATQAAVRTFADRGGNVINVSSVVSTNPVPNGAVYSATKAAVDAFTKSLAAELGPRKIRINSVLPGATETEGFKDMPGSDELRSKAPTHTALGRLGQPSDIASVVAFLASDDSGWITGQLITASGGWR